MVDLRLIRDGGPREIKEHVERGLAFAAAGHRLGVHMEGWRGVPLSKAKIAKDTVDRHSQARAV